MIDSDNAVAPRPRYALGEWRLEEKGYQEKSASPPDVTLFPVSRVHVLNHCNLGENQSSKPNSWKLFAFLQLYKLFVPSLQHLQTRPDQTRPKKIAEDGVCTSERADCRQKVSGSINFKLFTIFPTTYVRISPQTVSKMSTIFLP